MKLQLAVGVGIVALLGLLGVTIAEMQSGRAEQALQSGPAPGETLEPVTVTVPVGQQAAVEEAVAGPFQPVSLVERPRRDTDPRRARGLYIRPDGITVGRVNYIDRSTLMLRPIPNALVSFLQHRKIVAQVVTDERGLFAVPGLTPWAVYSVTATSPDWVCMFSTVIRPFDHHDEPLHRAPAVNRGAGAIPGWVNEIRFVAMLADEEMDEDEPASQSDTEPPAGEADMNDGTVEDFLDYEFHEFQLLPREDFIAALQAGLFGFDVGGFPCAPTCAGAGIGGGGIGGGGGGGGGGGAAGGGLGGALIGAGIGAGIGAAIGAGSSDGDRASPFEP